ncbi:MAG: hypothetical protein ACE366_28820 [Bradymonadia bacterium]
MVRFRTWAAGIAVLAFSASASAQQQGGGGAGIGGGGQGGGGAGGVLGGRTQPWTFFASGSVFSTLEATNTRQLDELTGGEDGEQQDITTQRTENTRTLAGYSILGATGIRYLTPKTDTLAAYTVGGQVAGDLILQPEDLLQAVLIQTLITPTPRWRINVGGNLFWGVFRAEQDLGTAALDPTQVGGGQLPGDAVDPNQGGVQTPEVTNPEDQQGINAQGATGARLISIVRYIRHTEFAGVAYTYSPTTRILAQAGFDSQLFIDRDLIREFNLNFFDSQALNVGINWEHTPAALTRLNLTLQGNRTWFQPVSTREGVDAGAQTATQSVLGSGGIAYNLTPLWSVGAELGMNLLYPVDDPDQQQIGVLARGLLIYTWQQWRYEFAGFRAIQRSELGAVFDNIGGTVSILGQFIDQSNFRATVGYIRQQPLLVVALPGETPEEALERGDTALTSDNFQGAVNYLYQLSNRMVLSLAYNYNHRFSGIDRQDQQVSHRFLLGLTINYPGLRPGAPQ